MESSRSATSRQSRSSKLQHLFLPDSLVKGDCVLIGNEVIISRELIRAGVPHIMPNCPLPPNAQSDKKSLVLELAPYGTFAAYAKKHYDPQTGYVLPQYRIEHLLCLYYMAETFAALHKLAVVHGDLRTENILVMNDKPLVVRLIDFGLTGMVGTHVYAMPGTYPAPEEAERCEQDSKIWDEAEAQLRTSYPVPNDEFLLKMDELRESHGIPRTRTSDLWAFGIFLLKTMYSDSNEEYKLLFSHLMHMASRAQADEALTKLLIKIGGNSDPVVQLAIRLLSKDPSNRPPMEEVKARVAAEL